MKTILMSTIALGAILVVAGFAIQPVQQAQAVHTTIQASSLNVLRLTAAGVTPATGATDRATWTMTTPFIVSSIMATDQVDAGNDCNLAAAVINTNLISSTAIAEPNPAILTATVLIAGMFAFMPVEKASTVHTTIQASTNDLIVTTDTSTMADTVAAATVNHDITCTGDVLIDAIEVNLPDNDATDNYLIAATAILVDGRAIGNGAVDPAADAALDDELVLGTADIGRGGAVALQSGNILRVPIQETDVTDGADATATWRIVIEANAGTTCSVVP